MLKENNIKTKDTLALKTKNKAFLSHLRQSKGNSQPETGHVAKRVEGGYVGKDICVEEHKPTKIL